MIQQLGIIRFRFQLVALFLFPLASFSQSLIQDSIPPIVMDTVVEQHPVDTIKKKKPSTLNDTYFFRHEPEVHYRIDTSIFYLQDYEPVMQQSIPHFNMGNTGTAAYPLLFNKALKIGFSSGYNQFHIYHFTRDSIRYYQVVRPYTELSYSIGIGNEQVFEGKFANAHKSGILYGVDFKRIFSKGTYTNQTTNDNGFSLYGIYNSKNKRWGIQTDLVFNASKVQENGGVISSFPDSVFTGYFQKTEVPVHLSNGANNYKQVDFYLTGNYNLGRAFYVRKDTIRERTTLPLFKVGYQLNLGSEKNWYFDSIIDSAYYVPYYTNRNSIVNAYKDLKVSNALQLEYTGKKFVNDSTSKEVNLIALASLNLDYHKINQNGNPNYFNNLYLNGVLKNNPNMHSKLIYQALVTYYFAGYNRNDLLLDGTVGLDYSKFGRLTANVSYQLTTPDWIFKNYRAAANSYAIDLPQQSFFKVGGKYAFTNRFLEVHASVYNNIVKNLAYYTNTYRPSVNSGVLDVLVFNIGNHFSIKGFHLDNEIYLQKVSNINVLHLPSVTTKNSIYYDVHLFKKVLWLATGFDLRWYSSFNAPDYFPLTGQFYLQNDLRMKYYPVLDFFIDAKLRTVRFFIKATNISSFFGTGGYFTGNLYPAKDFSVMFGFKWRFFE